MALSKQQLAEACAEAMWADDKASQGLGMVIENVRLEEKSGGKSGHWRRSDFPDK